MPRTYDNGCFFTVTLSRADVDTWAQSWPCFGTRRALWFQFDKRNGDLVDMGNTAGIDDSAALAMSRDAHAYGCARLLGNRVAFTAGMGSTT